MDDIGKGTRADGDSLALQGTFTNLAPFRQHAPQKGIQSILMHITRPLARVTDNDRPALFPHLCHDIGQSIRTGPVAANLTGHVTQQVRGGIFHLPQLGVFCHLGVLGIAAEERQKITRTTALDKIKEKSPIRRVVNLDVTCAMNEVGDIFGRDLAPPIDFPDGGISAVPTYTLGVF